MTPLERTAVMTPSLRFERVKTPPGDGELLIEPPAAAVGDLLRDNASRQAAAADCELGGMTLGQLRREARGELVSAAAAYTRSYRDVTPPPGDQPPESRPLLLAGHQPELFHPGVWVKNFVLSQLARDQAAIPINLVIDGDLARHTSIRSPSGTPAAPRLEAIEFAPRRPEIALGEYRIEDWPMLATFADRVQTAVAPLIEQPLVQPFWRQVLARTRATDNLAAALSQGRHAWEANWGGQTWELPQSKLSRTRAFAWFAVHLLSRAEYLHACYNDAIDQYRLVHKVRSAAHPAPLLARQDAWYEMPLWMWTAADPRRRPLYARVAPGWIELTDRGDFYRLLTCRSLSELADAVDQFQRMIDEGVVVQTRALTTTLFARVVLGDLFLHGIGGAKYDRATDLLIEQIFQLEPPHYVVASATKRLPIPLDRPPAKAAGAIKHRLRSLKYHPEWFLDDVAAADRSAASDLIARKQQWIDEIPTPDLAKRRYHEIRAANEALASHLQSQREELAGELAALRRANRRAELLAARDFSFVLYPEKTLAEFFRDAC